MKQAFWEHIKKKSYQHIKGWWKQGRIIVRDALAGYRKEGMKAPGKLL